MKRPQAHTLHAMAGALALLLAACAAPFTPPRPIEPSPRPGPVSDAPPAPTGVSLAGTVRQAGLGLAGVAISLTDGAGVLATATTDGQGDWHLDAVRPGGYGMLATKAGLTIVPDRSSRDLQVASVDQSGLDFTAFAGQATAISRIQGRSLLSTLDRQAVERVLGVVTLVAARQFYIQSLDPDQDAASSEGLLVYQGSPPGVRIGDWVSVDGTVSEYYPNGLGYGGLSVTELKNPVTTVLSRGHPLPAPVILGGAGRLPPDEAILDGLDFWESLEGMRVCVPDAQAVGPTINYDSRRYRETAVVAENGVHATGMTARGGIGLSPGDSNPEIVIVNDQFCPMDGDARVGDRWPGRLTGVLDYSHGVYKMLATERPALAKGRLDKETTPLTSRAGSLTVGSYNTENLSAVSPTEVLGNCAQTIVDHLRSPDILVLCEVQDNNGPAAGGTDASASWRAIVTAVQARGGPAYRWRDIAGENNKDGGAANGNIRQGFLYNPDRVQFVDRPGGTATAATVVGDDQGVAVLSCSPGRIKPADAAFAKSRKPLIGEFIFAGQRLFIIAKHCNSKSGDTPLWGRQQPAVLASEAQRLQQAAVVADFVGQILAIEAEAKIILAGDFNDFEFSAPITRLLGTEMNDLVLLAAKEDRYSYVFGGNSQVLDHIIVSPALMAAAPECDFVHCNAEYPARERSSDHDPLVARFGF